MAEFGARQITCQVTPVTISVFCAREQTSPPATAAAAAAATNSQNNNATIRHANGPNYLSSRQRRRRRRQRRPSVRPPNGVVEIGAVGESATTGGVGRRRWLASARDRLRGSRLRESRAAKIRLRANRFPAPARRWERADSGATRSSPLARSASASAARCLMMIRRSSAANNTPLSLASSAACLARPRLAPDAANNAVRPAGRH